MISIWILRSTASAAANLRRISVRRKDVKIVKIHFILCIFAHKCQKNIFSFVCIPSFSHSLNQLTIYIKSFIYSHPKNIWCNEVVSQKSVLCKQRFLVICTPRWHICIDGMQHWHKQKYTPWLKIKIVWTVIMVETNKQTVELHFILLSHHVYKHYSTMLLVHSSCWCLRRQQRLLHTKFSSLQIQFSFAGTMCVFVYKIWTSSQTKWFSTVQNW